MIAEIISIGSELTSGQNLDTNSRWLSLRLAALGVPVRFHTTVSDDHADNVAVFRTATSRADLVIVTGGLGPTQDDLTREVLAEVAGVELFEDAESLAHIRGLFARRNREMPDRNRVQALVPRGGVAIPNPLGTAPGVWIVIGKSTVVAMPGVPSEMMPMFDEHVVPRLAAVGIGGNGVFVQRKINTFGLGESAVEEKLFDLTRRGNVPEVGITVHDASISLRILAHGESSAAVRALIDPIEATIRERLGELVYGVDDEELHHVVMHELIRRKRTVATAESVTGGLIAHRLSNVPGASDHLMGGVVAYTNAVKIRELNVSPDLIEKFTAVSDPVAKAMAEGVRRKFSTDYGVASTGYAGPTGEQVGLVFVAVASSAGSRVLRFTWGGTRTEIQNRTAKMAINLLRLQLLADPESV